MKKYHIMIICGSGITKSEVIADHFHTTTNGSTSSGYYAFYKGIELVACYPIDRTVIHLITEIKLDIKSDINE